MEGKLGAETELGIVSVAVEVHTVVAYDLAEAAQAGGEASGTKRKA